MALSARELNLMESLNWLEISGVVTVMVALVHSVLGEVLIFKRMREGTIVPTKGQPVLRERHVRILWATWHIVSIFGVAFAAVLIGLSHAPETSFRSLFLIAVAVSMAVSSALVLFATKGMHPGWIGLLIVAVSAAFAL